MTTEIWTCQRGVSGSTTGIQPFFRSPLNIIPLWMRNIKQIFFSKKTKVEQSLQSEPVFKKYFIILEYMDKPPFCILVIFLDKQCWFSELEGSHSGTQSHLPLWCQLCLNIIWHNWVYNNFLYKLALSSFLSIAAPYCTRTHVYMAYWAELIKGLQSSQILFCYLKV